MEPSVEPRKESAESEFARAVSERQASFLAEFWHFLRHSKKWWLIPILVALLVVGLLVLLTSSSLAPFLYPLF